MGAAIQEANAQITKQKVMGRANWQKLQARSSEPLPLWLPLSQTTGQDQKQVAREANPKKASKLTWMASEMDKSTATRVEDEKAMGVWEHAPKSSLQMDKNAWIKSQFSKAKAAKKEAHHKKEAYKAAGQSSAFFEIM